MQTIKHTSLEVFTNPYSLKNCSLDRLTNQITSTNAKVHELEALRLIGSEVPASVEGIEKILASHDTIGYN